MHFWRKYNESSFKSSVIPWVTVEKVRNKLTAWQLFLNLYRTVIVFLLKYQERSFIKSTDYLFQLVSVTAFTFRKEAPTKREQFRIGWKSLSTATKSFPNKFVKVSTCRMKTLNKRKRFPQDRKSVSTIRNEIPFTSRSI